MKNTQSTTNPDYRIQAISSQEYQEVLERVEDKLRHASREQLLLTVGDLAENLVRESTHSSSDEKAVVATALLVLEMALDMNGLASLEPENKTEH